MGVYYGVSVRTCLPADPESKGGVEATVRIAKADLVPTDTNQPVPVRGPQNLVHLLCKSDPRPSLPRQARGVPGEPRTPWHTNPFCSMTWLVPVAGRKLIAP
jgi:hypothetical protein